MGKGIGPADECRPQMGIAGRRSRKARIGDGALGGVPACLSHIQRGQSAAEAINRICFADDGPLRREFSQLYRSLFDDHARHVAIVRALGTASRGLTQTEIRQRAGLSSGGSLSRALRELQECGFVQYLNSFGKRENAGRYVLVDELSHFHLRWLERGDALDRTQ